MTHPEDQARAKRVLDDWWYSAGNGWSLRIIGITIYVGSEIAAVRQSAQQAEQERCAALVEGLDLINPSGMTSLEQLHTYAVLAKAAEAIRRPRPEGGPNE